MSGVIASREWSRIVKTSSWSKCGQSVELHPYICSWYKLVIQVYIKVIYTKDQVINSLQWLVALGNWAGGKTSCSITKVMDLNLTYPNAISMSSSKLRNEAGYGTKLDLSFPHIDSWSIFHLFLIAACSWIRVLGPSSVLYTHHY